MSLYQYRIPASLGGEIDELDNLIKNHLAGAVSAAQLKPHRVPFGVYEQRTKGTYMVRIRCAAGIVSPAQLSVVAQLSKQYGSGRLHLTTRQEIQIHDVTIKDLATVIRALAAIGLSTRGGGGNTVRNITASWDSGITPVELFDVTPYAVELTSRLIAQNDSWLLPRKYKIAFSNSDADSAFATVNDLGFIARVQNGEPGFKVFVAGGMGRKPEPAHVLYDFAPASDVYVIAEALKRLFSKHGNRRNRHAARLRFVWNSIGPQRFVELFEEEKASVIAEHPAPFIIQSPAEQQSADAPAIINNTIIDNSEFSLWRKRYVSTQKQAGQVAVRIPVTLGDIQADSAILLANHLEPMGNDTIRLTLDQNIVLRNISVVNLDGIYALSKNITPLTILAPIIGDSVSCAGASTCQLGICLSRGALTAIFDELQKSDIVLDELSDFRIHISGCANSCGQHGIAHLGFYGKAGSANGKSYPAYSIVVGANLDGKGTSQLAEKVAEISTRKLPLLVRDFVTHYINNKKSYPSYRDYLDHEGCALLSDLSQRYSMIPSFETDPLFYRDWESVDEFSLAGRGTGECAAGLFDLIDLDLNELRQLRESLNNTVDQKIKNEIARKLALVSMRALLIAKGEQAGTDAPVIASLFEKHFIDESLVMTQRRVIVNAIKSNTPDVSSLFTNIVELSIEIEKLHLSLDDTLQFHPRTDQKPIAELVIIPDMQKDFRGVACPMNFVKTKMALSQITAGQVLEILLDDGAPIENVPGSVEGEGHTILARNRIVDHWQVLIKKGS